jgi:mannose-6-phosphate isomerase-like protein (cupin superfamily)
LLLEGATTMSFSGGDVHGFENTGRVDFVYLSVTSPPVNFRAAYAADWQPGGTDSA